MGVADGVYGTFFISGTTSFKVSVGYDKEEALDCSLVATTGINI